MYSAITGNATDASFNSSHVHSQEWQELTRIHMCFLSPNICWPASRETGDGRYVTWVQRIAIVSSDAISCCIKKKKHRGVSERCDNGSIIKDFKWMSNRLQRAKVYEKNMRSTPRILLYSHLYWSRCVIASKCIWNHATFIFHALHLHSFIRSVIRRLFILTKPFHFAMN